jgi:hypothetical protein
MTNGEIMQVLHEKFPRRSVARRCLRGDDKKKDERNVSNALNVTFHLFLSIIGLGKCPRITAGPESSFGYHTKNHTLRTREIREI